MIKMKLYHMTIGVILIGSINAKAHVGLDYPVGGETFLSGSVVEIRWQIVVDHGDNVWDLLFSSDGGSTWDPLATDLPKTQLTYQWTVPSVTTSQGIIRVIQNNVSYPNLHDDSGEFSIGSTGVIHDDFSQPGKFHLKPAYPNPFNGGTVFSFEVREPTHIKLSVFDIQGREIQTLIDGHLNSGFHTNAWNPEGIAAGIYLYGLSDGEQTQFRRVLYLK